MTSTSLVPIGDIARLTGISVSAVRYYDEIGLITTAARISGKRRFDPETAERVKFILRAQEAGFSLDEIRTILDDRDGDWRSMVQRKIVEMTGLRQRLDETISMFSAITACDCDDVLKCQEAKVVR